MDELPGKHRLIFDSVSADGFSEALLFANNFIIANRNDYGLANTDLAIIVVARHLSTGLGFNDSIWAKYGAQIASMSRIANVPKANPNSTGSLSIDSLAKQGVKFAVCAMATRRLAGSIAKATAGTEDSVNSELISNLVPGARMVPAGIVAVNRAQERGYSLVSA